ALLDAGYDVQPIVSETAAATDPRFGTAEALLQKLEDITGRPPIKTIREAEPLGPKIHLDALIISPCTGNTLAKLAHGITDTAVCMAAKAHLRSGRPLLIALASNDALSANLGNLALLLQRKNVFFVPLSQDDPVQKPHSLVADFTKLTDAYTAMCAGKQLRPLFI
ncbi:MAG: dipicolinate synthase subunit B, partial [Clostridia bacterium]|nr:dipicolinate synthase subunit B [Clostridia bacterium]MBO5671019.1 dipicolinate synthase subunit B [Clostridia bacterium]